MKFDTLTIRGLAFEIEVDDRGSFFCRTDGGILKATTLEGLKKKLTEHSRAKQVNISIPFVYWDDGGWDTKNKLIRGVCVGIHAGNDNLLVKLGNGDVQQLSGYRNSDKYVAPEHGQELARIQRAIQQLKKERDEFYEKFALDLRAMIIKALEGK